MPNACGGSKCKVKHLMKKMYCTSKFVCVKVKKVQFLTSANKT